MTEEDRAIAIFGSIAQTDLCTPSVPHGSEERAQPAARANAAKAAWLSLNVRQKMKARPKRTVAKQKKRKRSPHVRAPDLGKDIGLLLCGAAPEGGHRGLVDGDYLILLCGNSKGLKKLGHYLLSLANLDTSEDPAFHHHFPAIRSLSDTKLELMVRKNKAAHYDYTK